jgi:hypothetical protein
MSGGGNFQKHIIDAMRYKPVHCYLGGAVFLFALRQYQTQSTYNYWFGKIEFQRRLERKEI